MATDPLDIEASPPRFVVGIDFGTTNSAVAYVDTLDDDWRVQIFPIPQVVAPGEVEARDTLPSFHYEPVNSEFSEEMLRLPWGDRRQGSGNKRDHVVGLFARDHGAGAPGRLVASAKSWLCHTGVDRTAELLHFASLGLGTPRASTR
jgi:molecular chaperone DnaK (HSP70)